MKPLSTKSRCKAQIIQGIMASSLFSGLFGTQVPGEGCVYKSQNIRFKRPVYVGDEVTAKIEVVNVDINKKVISFTTRCLVNGKVMIHGESEICVPQMTSLKQREMIKRKTLETRRLHYSTHLEYYVGKDDPDFVLV